MRDARYPPTVSRRLAICSFPLLFFLLSVLPPVAALAEDEANLEGIPRVQNGATPRDGKEIMELRELWRAGGEDDEIFFGFVTQVLSDADGNIYVMDQQLSEVHVYSPEGEHLRTLGREGDGPGETRRPGDMLFVPSGELGMVQTFPGKVVLVDLEGNPAGTLDFDTGDPNQGRFAVLVRAMAGGGNLVLGGIQMTFDQSGQNNQTYFLSTCDESGKEKKRLMEKEYAINFADFVMDEMGLDFAWGRSAVGANGRIYVAPHRNKYEILAWHKDGTLDRIMEREYKSLAREEVHKQQARSVIEGVAMYYGTPPREITIEETHPDIGGLTVADDGKLWVRTSRGDNGQPDGILATLDVFDEEGNFVKQVSLSGPGDGNEDAVYMLGKNRVVVVTGALEAFRTMQGVSGEESEEEVTPLEVIVYEMSPLQAKG